MARKRKHDSIDLEPNSENYSINSDRHSPPSKRRPSFTGNDRSGRLSLAREMNGHEEGDGWTKVERKHYQKPRDVVVSSSPRQSSKKQMRKLDDRDAYPQLIFQNNHKANLKIKDLQNLALYVLINEKAPNWVAVRNARGIKKVIVLMIPGLDKDMLVNAVKKQERATKPSDDTVADSLEASPTNRQGLTSATGTDWLLYNLLEVNAPGDTNRGKIHSPLQAMLLSHDESKRNSSNSNESYQSSRVPMIDLIHTADELREADFPIHPTLFTNAVDAELEASRREKTGQSIKNGWVDTHVGLTAPVIDPKAADKTSQGLQIYSLDCEMVLTTDDVYSLARISLISYPKGKVVFDKYVKPSLPIKDYFTQYSGVTSAHLEHVTTTLQDIQNELLELLNEKSVLMGHSLDSDLTALKMTHPFVIDTSLIYPHPRGLPLRSSLKYLANKYLRREIQIGMDGHDSTEDALAVLDLVKLKCEKGLRWGTMENNGEPVFKRLKENGRTSAIVEYGTPEKGYGKDATVKIGGETDDDILNGVRKTLLKSDDPDNSKTIDFTWARLRAVEYARGFVTGSHGEILDGDVAVAVSDTLRRIREVYNNLPERTLFILFNGTGDVRPVMRLQAQQQMYRKEFKVKKWDELTIKWTDTEEQALRRACDDARKGWGVCVIK